MVMLTIDQQSGTAAQLFSEEWSGVCCQFKAVWGNLSFRVGEWGGGGGGGGG